MLVVLSHGHGNIGSLSNALTHLGIKHEIVEGYKDCPAIENISGFILPGVGSYDAGMRSMRDLDLDKLVQEFVVRKIKGMGICLGMQMLCEKSEEGDSREPGLSVFKGLIKRLSPEDDCVPNIGWSRVESKPSVNSLGSSPIIDGEYYFAHSYALDSTCSNHVVATIKHGRKDIPVAIYKDNILGVQFHPEKSQIDGLSLIKNYFED